MREDLNNSIDRTIGEWHDKCFDNTLTEKDHRMAFDILCFLITRLPKDLQRYHINCLQVGVIQREEKELYIVPRDEW